MAHSEAFVAVRDALEALDESDRRRLATLLGCMTAPQPALSADLHRALAAIARLDVADRERLAKWCAAYVNAWGQLPESAAMRIKAK
jgi:hypothetical protein